MNTETMYDRIMLKLAERKETPGAMCNELGIRRATISDLKSGKSANLSAVNIARISRYLHCSCDYLIHGNNMFSEFTPLEQSLVSAWRLATDKERENVAFILRDYDFSYKAEPAEDTKQEDAV